MYVKMLGYEVAYKEFFDCDYVLSDGVFCCTWCCEVAAGIACSRVVPCGVVTKLCVGADVLVGILGVR
ncbi:hypothetical protein F2Q70_00022466 [Brassica cretica]|uniref:Uncharacterized protein n=1 Tax=Brassica cretica TaxID=69181 RepID=A0A8S9GTC2_BRACR|nr:hypothetical protein F2Q70_00022466 [Brassica cretica]